MHTFPKEQLENKRYRLHVLQEAEHNTELQLLLQAKGLQDIVYFVNVFGWTYDPRKSPSKIPFITYEFQDETLLQLVDAIQNEKDVFVEKSRDMGFSWMLVALQVWAFLNGMPSLYGSYKEDYVDSNGDLDSHFERMRYFISMLPTWMVPDDLVETYMSISSQKLKSEISGDAGANFGTGGRRKFVVMDEFALWQHDKKAFRKTKDIARCRIVGGTPEGKYNVYGQVMTKQGEYANLDVVRIRLHWTLHPEKTMEWYEAEKARRTPLDVAKELDISYEDSVTGAVYPEFNERVQITHAPYNSKLPLFTAWDFGRDMNVILWIQKDYYTGMVYIIDGVQLKNKTIDYMAAFVVGEPSFDPVTGEPYRYDDDEMRMIDKHKDWVGSYAFHCGDPYNADSKTTNATSSIKQILAEYNIHLRTVRGTTLEERIRKAHLALPRLVVEKTCIEFIQAMVQSRYPEESRSQTREKTKPIHDEYSHMRTAFEYWCDNEPVVDPYKKRVSSDPIQPNYLTGETTQRRGRGQQYTPNYLTGE